ncbi:N, N'-diacetylbacillosaminyl-diphospho-undecaprenol alpha-1,3-N-acetylgalactosaminyltransferase [Ruegeria arenilitoris]|uniref:N, N'-diacetylbacillosaminyl-diphospho-undecaprenol alpha-1,3-N-acetylgalactosaminyltransferase n=1 Tax=Ruegeria arenilitoris TaxID=1173585 RepID=A0A238KEK3_9RHOB|nr:N, N'-diacetylbacillosaminyl-diphospho-undecaprenol alpha-1,3-N-acetylgalactosaminyltransferase [Ruegeria arenilitoris]
MLQKLKPQVSLPTRARPRIVVVANLTASLLNFRYDLLKELSERAEVVACGPERHEATETALAEIGVEFVQFPLSRAGMNPVEDMRTLRALVRVFKEFKPDIVFAYTMKPIIYGCLAAKWAGVDRIYAMNTGLGYVYSTHGLTFRRRAVRAVSSVLYRIALRGVDEVLVYNRADAEEFRERRLVAPDAKLSIVPGSGVNLDRYGYTDSPAGPPVFLMISRLLREKGVFDFVQAARLLKETHPQARCQLLGPMDANPDSIGQREIDEWTREGVIEYLGETSDVRPYLAACSIFVLPSAYREGIPRTILEAMSSGRAVITSDAPGCADPVINGETGYVVPVRNPEALSRAMASFVESPDLVARMGLASRKRAEDSFDVRRINAILLGKMGFSTNTREDEAS